MENLIVPFNTTTLTLKQAGGKGLNLSKTARAGFPVPPGFIVTTEAYRLFTRTNQIDAAVQTLSQDLSVDDPAALQAASQKIFRLFEAGGLPIYIQTSLLTAYHQLSAQTNQAAVAVRSSATAEDLPGASFAGQQDTYLNVSGDEALLLAVKHCWASLWTERAMAYRARQANPPVGVALAVVIQHMIPAESAGVMFTANPVTGARNEIVINASWGLGEAIVGGLVAPDNLVVDKATGKPASAIIADKSVMTVRTETGTQEVPVPSGKSRQPTLSKPQVAELAGLGAKIEQFYGAPQDIEWCYADGQFYIVQVRPITSLPPEPLQWAPPGAGQWLHGGGTFEMITEPFSPLFETFLLPIFVDVITDLLESAGLQGVLPPVPYRIVNGHIYLHMDLRLRPWHLAGVLRDFAMHLNSLQGQEGENLRYRQAVAGLSQPDLAASAGLSSARLLERMQALGQAGMRYWLQIMKIVQVIYRQENAFTKFYNRRLRLRCTGIPEPEIFLRGQKVKPWQAECSAFDLAQMAQKLGLAKKVLEAPEELLNGTEGGAAVQAFRAAFATHLDLYGHQLASFDLSLPTLADDPRPVLTAIQTYILGKESPYIRQQHMQAQSEAAIATAEGCLSGPASRKFRQLLSTAQQAACTREDALFDVGLAWTPMHRTALELGRRLVQKGLLAQPADIFWLNLAEIQQAFEGPGQPGRLFEPVASRQADHRAWSGADAPYLLPQGSRPAFWWKWVFPTPELNRQPDAHTIVGLGVSPGKVTGVARLLHSLDEMQRIQAGDILVTRSTTPAWTPLFARLGGLVTDLGGPLAHGSIVAREYGIPAVMGTGSATQRIKDGQIITVDGSSGRVTLN